MRPRPVSACLATATLLIAMAAPAWAASDHERSVDLTFPVAGRTTFTDTYHADRSGGERKHQATDLMGKKLQTVHAARAGTICTITGLDGPPPAYGYYLSLCGDDGRRYNYVHLNNDRPGTDDGQGGPRWAYAPGIRKDVKVKRGQWLGYLGDSGNAETTAPHLHFEIVDPELDDPRLDVAPYQRGRMNPYRSLRDALERRDLPKPVPVGDWLPVAGPVLPLFGDIGGNAHADNIVQLVERGITQGCNATAYCPSLPVTRAQLATFLVRAKDLPVVAGTRFPDVPEGAAHADAINTVVGAGYAQGRADGRYDPGGALTRAQMATFLTRAMHMDVGDGQPEVTAVFDDVDPQSVHAAAIGALADSGVTKGCSQGRYCPAATVSRDALASFLVRAIERGL